MRSTNWHANITPGTKEVYCQINDQFDAVDEDIADLLKVMWDLGIETFGSSQCFNTKHPDKNKAGKVFIRFESVDYKTFMSLIMNYNSFSDDETEIYDLCDYRRNKNDFYSEFYMMDNNDMFRGENEEFMKNESGALLVDVFVRCELWFPKEYINKIIEKLKRPHKHSFRYDRNMKISEKVEPKLLNNLIKENETLTNDQITK